MNQSKIETQNLNKPMNPRLRKAGVIKSVCDIKEQFITCMALDKSKIGCVYCRHFKQTVL